MLKRFIDGDCSLAEAFWKFSVLGILVCSFATRIFMTMLKQTVGYDMAYIHVVINNLSLISMDTVALPWLCCYTTAFLTLIGYSFLCLLAMWRTYKEYEKSKILALICLALVMLLAYTGIKQGIY